MTAREFCGAIGYAPSHFKRLRSFLLGIKLNFGGKAERLCTMEYTELDEAVKVWINPHVFYSGTNWEAVETLGCLSWV